MGIAGSSLWDREVDPILARLSASSFSSIPECPGPMSLSTDFSVPRLRVSLSSFISFEAVTVDLNALISASLSEQIVIFSP